jgi:hypothetical protein
MEMNVSNLYVKVAGFGYTFWSRPENILGSEESSLAFGLMALYSCEL